jgi:hypothetical protein
MQTYLIAAENVGVIALSFDTLDNSLSVLNISPGTSLKLMFGFPLHAKRGS